jgi:hypothetical protein
MQVGLGSTRGWAHIVTPEGHEVARLGYLTPVGSAG